MSNLKELREDWERGLTILAEIPDCETQFMVILHDDNFPPERYCLHRYFKLDESWQISVDYSDTSLHDLIEHMGNLGCWSIEIPEDPDEDTSEDEEEDDDV